MSVPSAARRDSSSGKDRVAAFCPKAALAGRRTPIRCCLREGYDRPNLARIWCLAGRAHEVLQPKLGTAHAAVIRYAIVLLGGLGTILIALQLFGIAVTQLLVGGAFATVLVGIAAQQSLSNVFAGLVLLLARPVDLGDRVWIKSGPLGGELRGTVTEIGITYVRLDTPDGPLHLPNSQVLASAIAPVVSSPPDRT